MKPRFVTTLPMILLAVMVILGGFATSVSRTFAQDENSPSALLSTTPTILDHGHEPGYAG